MKNHIVALSGGKDSTAMALRLVECESEREYQFVCTPTGGESTEMFDHWKRLGDLLGSPIIPIVAGTLDGLVAVQNAIPNWRQRWCTRILKIEPFAAYISSVAPCVSYVGLRIDEPLREGGDYYREIPGCEMDFPLRRWRWTLHDVRSYLAKRNIQIPRRTDCLKCFFQRLDEWYNLWVNEPEIWMDAERQESMTGHTWRSPGRDAWPTALKDLRASFESGKVPKRSQDPLSALKCRVCRL